MLVQLNYTATSTDDKKASALITGTWTLSQLGLGGNAPTGPSLVEQFQAVKNELREIAEWVLDNNGEALSTDQADRRAWLESEAARLTAEIKGAVASKPAGVSLHQQIVQAVCDKLYAEGYGGRKVSPSSGGTDLYIAPKELTVTERKNAMWNTGQFAEDGSPVYTTVSVIYEVVGSATFGG